jgi:hypothetical protein
MRQEIELPNEYWSLESSKTLVPKEEILLLRSSENPYSDFSLLLSFCPILEEYHLHFSEGADYKGHFGVKTLDGPWDGSFEDIESKLRMAEGVWKKWSKKADDKLTPNENKRSTLYREWKHLVNMSPRSLRSFMNSNEGKAAGLSKSAAKSLGIGRGWDSAKAILRMKAKPIERWSTDDWDWAKRQVSFIKRMSGNKGPLYDAKGNKTRKHTSLLIWGHDPA